jgi:hypothetical protein
MIELRAFNTLGLPPMVGLTPSSKAFNGKETWRRCRSCGGGARRGYLVFDL